MDNKRPLILLSNDDGVDAKGINELIGMLSTLGNILVVAPDGPRSGAACSITSRKPLHCTVRSERPGVKVCVCEGTPVDCIKMALEVLEERKPDVVIGGINHGNNASISVHYSGTMGVALEGCMKGIPSIGLSLDDFDKDADFSQAAPFVRHIVGQVLQEGLPQGVCLNVNFPKCGPEGYQGLKVCRMARGMWINEWERETGPQGITSFQLTGVFSDSEPECTDTDLWAMAHGFVAVTPVKIDMTAYDVLESLKTMESL